MLKMTRDIRCWVVAGMLLLLLGCVRAPKLETPQVDWAEQNLGGFPYHPLVFHLDLSILTYQIYSQSLVWPFDPYYEAMDSRRDQVMQGVHDWAKRHGDDPSQRQILTAYRGLGVLGGFANNLRHDPIIYNYLESQRYQSRWSLG